MFLRHEGFLGAMGAFISSDQHDLEKLLVNTAVQQSPSNVSYTVTGELLGDECIQLSVHAS